MKVVFQVDVEMWQRKNLTAMAPRVYFSQQTTAFVLQFYLTFFFFEVFITNFIKSSDPISNACYTLQYLHLDVRHDLVHNIHSIAIYISQDEYVGTAVAQWLTCCVTNRKVARSIAAGIIGFFIGIKSFRSHYGPGVDSASNRNECQEYFLGVKATGA